MTNSFQLDNPDDLGRKINFTLPEGTTWSRILDLLITVPESARFIELRDVPPAYIPGVFQMIVPHTRFFLDMEKFKQLRGDSMLALAVYATTQSAPAAFFASSVRKITENLKLLSDDENEVVKDYLARANNNPYGVGMAVADLQKGFVDTLIPFDAVLSSLEKKGVIIRQDGDTVLLAF
jgi:hypothetical protein